MHSDTNIGRTRLAQEALGLLPALMFGFSPVVGMLLAAEPVMRPPGVSVLRITMYVVLLCAALYLLARRRHRLRVASNIVGLPLFLVAMYPSMHSLVGSLSGISDRFVAGSYLIACLGAAIVAARLPDESVRSLHQFLVLMAVAFLGVSSFVVVRAYGFARPMSPATAAAVADLSEPPILPADVPSRPDVYHLMLDGMGRPDVLLRDYDMDTGAELERLRELGFTVHGDRGFANYLQTHLSLSSMLNLAYLDDLTVAQRGSGAREPLKELISRARVPAVFKALGYKIEYIGSGYLTSGAFELADICDCPQLWFADAEVGVLSLTPFKIFLYGGIGHYAHYRRMLDVFHAVERERLGPDPWYVFAHVAAPHPPFVTDSGGEFRQPTFPLSGADAAWFPGTPRDYVEGYRAQARFMLNRTLKALTAVVEASRRSDREVIVIVSGDHGPRLGVDPYAPTFVSGRSALPILLAIRWVPAGDRPAVSSLVNLYRAIFSSTFGLELPPLPDRGFVSPFSAPYDTTEVEGLALPARHAETP